MQAKTYQQFLWGALVGGSMAALTTLLLTPFSGQEARQKILDALPENMGRSPVAVKHTHRPAARSVRAFKAHKAKKHRNSD